MLGCQCRSLVDPQNYYSVKHYIIRALLLLLLLLSAVKNGGLVSKSSGFVGHSSYSMVSSKRY